MKTRWAGKELKVLGRIKKEGEPPGAQRGAKEGRGDVED